MYIHSLNGTITAIDDVCSGSGPIDRHVTLLLIACRYNFGSPYLHLHLDDSSNCDCQKKKKNSIAAMTAMPLKDVWICHVKKKKVDVDVKLFHNYFKGQINPIRLLRDQAHT